jgi:hypothetical protein
MQTAAGSFGMLALSQMLAAEDGTQNQTSAAALNGGLHHPAKVRRVIQLFMNGGVSQVDTFDYKPELLRRHGEQVDFGIKAASTSTPGPVMKSPFTWQQHGQCGQWVTNILPEMAGCVDDLAFLLALQSKTNVHGPASYLQTTGFLFPGNPCLGSWISYGLGRLSDDLPTFVVLPDPNGLPYNNMGNFSAGFLSAEHQGTVVGQAGPGKSPIQDLEPAAAASFVTAESSARGLDLLNQLNRGYAAERPGDSRLAARVQSYELAARMQVAAPEAFDISRESKAVQDSYGINIPDQKDGFARNCLLARRLVERGVRFVQVWSGAGGASNNWDNHSSIDTELPAIAKQVDRPTAALLKDLKDRGLLEDTLVIWTTEFGRMPFTQGSTGRDHNGGTSVTWLSGAGVRGGSRYGVSDDFGYLAADEKTNCYDMHATILHLMGIDHERLTVRHNGLDRRLTDVHGNVIRQILT